MNVRKNNRTCLECLALDYCLLRDIIRNPEIKHCDYAREGCKKYKGQKLTGSLNKIILKLLEKSPCTMAQIGEKTEIPITNSKERQVIHNAINRLKKSGYDIIKAKGFYKFRNKNGKVKV